MLVVIQLYSLGIYINFQNNANATSATNYRIAYSKND